MFWWVVTPILAFYLKMSTGVPIDRISHHCPFDHDRQSPALPSFHAWIGGLIKSEAYQVGTLARPPAQRPSAGACDEVLRSC